MKPPGTCSNQPFYWMDKRGRDGQGHFTSKRLAAMRARRAADEIEFAATHAIDDEPDLEALADFERLERGE